MVKNTEESKRQLEINKVLKQNQNFLNKISTKKAQRHVKEKNEPVLESMLEDFRNDYGRSVAAQSAMDILKLIR